MDTSDTSLNHRTLVHVLEAVLDIRPDQPALQDPRRTLTYAQMWSEACRFSHAFSTLGLQRQDAALIMLDNHVDNVLCWLGLSVGARLEIAINTAFFGEMLAYQISDSGARLLIVEERYLARVLDVAEAFPELKTVVVRRGQTDAPLDDDFRRAARLWNVRDFSELASFDPASPDRLDPWDLISISYTSGTTGRSKGALCPHAHAFGQATGMALGTTRPGEVRYVVLPQFHAAGRWGGVYNSFAREATAYLAPAFSASKYWELASNAHARTSQLVGTMADFLARQPERAADHQHSLREVAILPLPADLPAWKRRFGVQIATGYGSTEVGAVVETPDATSTSVGRARLGYEVRIFDEHDQECPDGVAGELVVRPDETWTTSVAYLNNPESSAKAWRNGWLHTGDALYREASGEFFFVDRLDDAIRRRGENISSAEVELHINACPGVLECAAIAAKSEYLEDEILIVVVPEPNSTLTEAGLIAHISKKMPQFMIPRYIRFLDHLPKTGTSKVMKSELRRAGLEAAWDRETARIL